MDGKIKIIPMTKEHAAAAAQIEKRCFSSPWPREAIEEELKEPGSVFYAAVWQTAACGSAAPLGGAAVAGYAGMRAVCGEGYIFNVAVLPEYRRRGAATVLLRALSDFAVKNRMAFLTLEVREHNTAARTLYEKEGFAVEGRRRCFYTLPDEDGIIMTKRLGENLGGNLD